MSGRSRDTLRSRSRALPLTPPLQSFGCGPYRSAWGVSRFAASGMYCTDIGMNRQYRNRYVMIDLCGYWVCTAKQAQKSPVARGFFVEVRLAAYFCEKYRFRTPSTVWLHRFCVASVISGTWMHTPGECRKESAFTSSKYWTSPSASLTV